MPPPFIHIALSQRYTARDGCGHLFDTVTDSIKDYTATDLYDATKYHPHIADHILFWQPVDIGKMADLYHALRRRGAPRPVTVRLLQTYNCSSSTVSDLLIEIGETVETLQLGRGSDTYYLSIDDFPAIVRLIRAKCPRLRQLGLAVEPAAHHEPPSPDDAALRGLPPFGTGMVTTIDLDYRSPLEQGAFLTLVSCTASIAARGWVQADHCVTSAQVSNDFDLSVRYLQSLPLEMQTGLTSLSASTRAEIRSYVDIVSFVTRILHPTIPRDIFERCVDAYKHWKAAVSVRSPARAFAALPEAVAWQSRPAQQALRRSLDGHVTEQFSAFEGPIRALLEGMAGAHTGLSKMGDPSTKEYAYRLRQEYINLFEPTDADECDKDRSR